MVGTTQFESCVIKLNNSWDSGVVSDIINDPNYIDLTTAAIKGNTIYAVNSKFSISFLQVLVECMIQQFHMK